MIYIIVGRGCGKIMMRAEELDKILKEHPNEKLKYINPKELERRHFIDERSIGNQDNSQRDQALGSEARS